MLAQSHGGTWIIHWFAGNLAPWKSWNCPKQTSRKLEVVSSNYWLKATPQAFKALPLLRGGDCRQPVEKLLTKRSSSYKSTLGMDRQKCILNILTNVPKKLIIWGDGCVKHLDISNYSTLYIYNHHLAHLKCIESHFSTIPQQRVWSRRG